MIKCYDTNKEIPITLVNYCHILLLIFLIVTPFSVNNSAFAQANDNDLPNIHSRFDSLFVDLDTYLRSIYRASDLIVNSDGSLSCMVQNKYTRTKHRADFSFVGAIGDSLQVRIEIIDSTRTGEYSDQWQPSQPSTGIVLDFKMFVRNSDVEIVVLADYDEYGDRDNFVEFLINTIEQNITFRLSCTN